MDFVLMYPCADGWASQGNHDGGACDIGWLAKCSKNGMTDIYAAADGVVEFSGDYAQSYGGKNYKTGCVIIRHPNLDKNKDIITIYFHLSSEFVKRGDYVKMGEVIGKKGSTGNSSGVHLHFQTLALSKGEEVPGNYNGAGWRAYSFYPVPYMRVFPGTIFDNTHANSKFFLENYSEKATKTVDISYANGAVNFDKLKTTDVSGVIARLGFTGWGSNKSSLDSQFERNYSECKRLDIPIGVYYFTLAFNEQMADMEADFILEHLKGRKLELPVYIDVEPQSNSSGWTNLSKKKRTDLVTRICSKLEHAGYFVGIYASKSWFTTMLDSRVDSYSKWVAQYNTTCTYDGKYDMWQYTSSGDGYSYGLQSKGMDLSYAYTDFDACIVDKNLNGYYEDTVEEPNEEKSLSEEIREIKERLARVEDILNERECD